MKKGTAEELLHLLNSVHPIIKFTMELEKDGTLLFLNTPLRRKKDGTLNITVYRKPIHTDWYLHFSLAILPTSGEILSDVSTIGPGVSPPQTTMCGRRRTTWLEF